MQPNKIVAALATAGMLTVGAAAIAAPSFANGNGAECVGQHYSWTGGPLDEGVVPSPPPAGSWQANTKQEPHLNNQNITWLGAVGDGLHYASKGGSGKADWFYFECVAPEPSPTPTPTQPAPTPPPTPTPTPTETPTQPAPTPPPTETPTPTPSETPTQPAPTPPEPTPSETPTAPAPAPTPPSSPPPAAPAPAAPAPTSPITGETYTPTAEVGALPKTGAAEYLLAAGLLTGGLGAALSWWARKGY